MAGNGSGANGPIRDASSSVVRRASNPIPPLHVRACRRFTKLPRRTTARHTLRDTLAVVVLYVCTSVPVRLGSEDQHWQGPRSGQRALSQAKQSINRRSSLGSLGWPIATVREHVYSAVDAVESVNTIARMAPDRDPALVSIVWRIDPVAASNECRLTRLSTHWEGRCFVGRQRGVVGRCLAFVHQDCFTCLPAAFHLATGTSFLGCRRLVAGRSIRTTPLLDRGRGRLALLSYRFDLVPLSRISFVPVFVCF